MNVIFFLCFRAMKPNTRGTTATQTSTIQSPFQVNVCSMFFPDSILMRILLLTLELLSSDTEMNLYFQVAQRIHHLVLSSDERELSSCTSFKEENSSHLSLQNDREYVHFLQCQMLENSPPSLNVKLQRIHLTILTLKSDP